MGNFALVLHSHLPYVISHGKWPHGSVWLVEAATECYLPLLDMCDGLVEDGIQPNITIGITPVLAEQLADPTFPFELNEYLELKIGACNEDRIRFKQDGDTQMAALADYWLDYYTYFLDLFNKQYEHDIIGQFRKLQDLGAIELITSSATHGYSPLIGYDDALRAQFRVGVETYKKHFHRQPRGIWLPECAYRPGYEWTTPVGVDHTPRMRAGIEELLNEVGLRYFIVDSHLTEGGKPIGAYLARFEGLRKLWEQFELSQPPQPEKPTSPYELHWVGDIEGKQPVGVFTRHPKTTLQVWSGEHGYPGDGYYLDFHKKHFPGGNRYWRVTSAKAGLGEKQPYEPDKVDWRLGENADHFVSLVQQAISEAEASGVKNPVVCAPFDTELFGHWWFEGIRWIDLVIRKLQNTNATPITLGEKLDSVEVATRIHLPEGSWGEGGYHHIWYNADTEWTWEIIYDCERRMLDAVAKYGNTTKPELKKALTQMGRELLLLESSDWQFLISTVSARDYAEMRFRVHHRDFDRMHEILMVLANDGTLTEDQSLTWEEIALRDGLFADLTPDAWRGKQ